MTGAVHSKAAPQRPFAIWYSVSDRLRRTSSFRLLPNARSRRAWRLRLTQNATTHSANVSAPTAAAAEYFGGTPLTSAIHSQTAPNSAMPGPTR